MTALSQLVIALLPSIILVVICVVFQTAALKIHVKDAENIGDHAPDTTLVIHHDRLGLN